MSTANTVPRTDLLIKRQIKIRLLLEDGGGPAHTNRDRFHLPIDDMKGDDFPAYRGPKPGGLPKYV